MTGQPARAQEAPAAGSTVTPPEGLAVGGMRGPQDPMADTATPDDTAADDGASASADGSASESDQTDTDNPATAVPAISGTRSPDSRPMFGRINLREKPIGGRGTALPPAPLDQGTGLRLGTMVLRPEVTQGIGVEDQKTGGAHTSRTYSQTEIRGTLTTDWSRHALTINGSGIYQKNIAGSGETQPSADINADLRLDLADQTTADFTAGYSLTRESVSDPNATAGAASQSTISSFTGGAELTRELGKLRGSVSAKAIRTTYGDVKLEDGSTLSQADRNTLAGEFAARIGYELSPALIPFLQMKYRRTAYDNTIDASGYRRSSDTYTAEAGVTADFGEKLSGEFAAGYVLRRFEDARLASLDGLAIDATGHWSPRRGTDVTVGFNTQIEDSTAAGQSGAVDYALSTGIAQIVREDVVARLGAQYLLRSYRDGAQANQNVYTATAGLSWYLNRSLSLDTDVSYQKTTQKGGGDQDIATVNVGLTLRR